MPVSELDELFRMVFLICCYSSTFYKTRSLYLSQSGKKRCGSSVITAKLPRNSSIKSPWLISISGSEIALKVIEKICRKESDLMDNVVKDPVCGLHIGSTGLNRLYKDKFFRFCSVG